MAIGLIIVWSLIGWLAIGAWVCKLLVIYMKSQNDPSPLAPGLAELWAGVILWPIMMIMVLGEGFKNWIKKAAEEERLPSLNRFLMKFVNGE